jgi:hypothetical protein
MMMVPIILRESRKTKEDTLQHPASIDIKCTVKKVSDIPVPSRDVTCQSLPGLGGNNLIIPAQGEIGK